MKTVIIANLQLLPTLLVFSDIPLTGAAYLAALVCASKRGKRLGRLWLSYYRQVLSLENLLLKGGAR